MQSLVYRIKSKLKLVEEKVKKNPQTNHTEKQTPNLAARKSGNTVKNRGNLNKLFNPF